MMLKKYSYIALVILFLTFLGGSFLAVNEVYAYQGFWCTGGMNGKCGCTGCPGWTCGCSDQSLCGQSNFSDPPACSADSCTGPWGNDRSFCDAATWDMSVTSMPIDRMIWINNSTCTVADSGGFKHENCSCNASSGSCSVTVQSLDKVGGGGSLGLRWRRYNAAGVLVSSNKCGVGTATCDNIILQAGNGPDHWVKGSQSFTVSCGQRLDINVTQHDSGWNWFDYNSGESMTVRPTNCSIPTPTPVPPTNTPIPTPVTCVVLNQGTGLSCDTVCSNNGSASCLDVGTDVNATGDDFYRYFQKACQLASGSCSTVMTNRSKTCGGKSADWTNCRCAGACVTPTLTPVPPTNTPTPRPTNTPTPKPTNTPVPTNTPIPTLTPTPIPTSTPVPTNTPVPTSTPIPTPTTTPIQQWFQVSGGVVAANKTSGYSINNPLNSLPPGKYFCSAPQGSAATVLAAETVSGFSLSRVHQTDPHLVISYGSITSSYTYTYFKNKYASRDSSSDSSAGPVLPTNLTAKSYYYYSNPLGALTVNAGTYTGNAVIIVEGDLSIAGDISLAANSSLAFFVKGRSGGGITLNSSVASIRGFFLTDGRFDDGASSNQLTVTGGVVANDFALRRTLSNNSQPAETFVSDPSIFVNLNAVLGERRYTWYEVAD